MDNSIGLISEKSEIPVNENQEISICEIMKNNTYDIIQKLEVEIPILFQNYSDLYSRYLHSIQDMFGVCHLTEKKYFDKFQVEQNILKTYDYNWKFMTSVAESQIDLSTNFLKSYVQFRLLSVDSWDKYAHIVMDSYARLLSGFIQNKS